MGISFLIYTITDQRIIYISQCNYLCGNRDFFSLQAIRVAFSIVTFMMPSADIMGNPNQRLVFVIFQALQHGSTDGTVCLDNLEFFLGQSAWFIQDLIIYTDLSDIVKRRCCNDHSSYRTGQIILVRFLYQSLQDQFRDNVDMQNMSSTLTISEFYDLA